MNQIRLKRHGCRRPVASHTLRSRSLSWLLAVAFALALPAVNGQQIELSNQTWSAQVIRPSGQPVIPLFDGWYPNEDGSATMCFGFFNMNTEQALDIPLGSANYLSDDRFEAQLPTHFDPLPPRYRHVFCAFSITVPGDFGEKIRWHLTSAGQELSVPGHLIPAYVMDEPVSDGRGDVAPLVRTQPRGEAIRGRTGIHHPILLETKVNNPLLLRAWVDHTDLQVWVGWAHHSGPGEVFFDRKEYEMETGEGPTEILARFSEPGSYIVRMQTIDDIAAFEFYCCHTNAYFHVNVTDQGN